MSDLYPVASPWQMFDGLRQWWRNWRGAGSSLTELACCGEYEVERMARDLGMPPLNFARSRTAVLTLPIYYCAA